MPVSGEHDLQTLLSSLEPHLLPDLYVFVVVPPSVLSAQLISASRAMVREIEGVTLVMTQACADQHGLKYESLMCWISLTVHSSLEAVGLTAAFSSALAAHKLSANVIAGTQHDHLLVPAKDAEAAVRILRELASDAMKKTRS